MKKLVIALCALAAASVQAGVKYWDNPAFKAYDADNYVQDGLVLHYDGIRNVGLNQPHSTTATTWVNLANPGTQDLTKGGTGKNSRWLDDGYFFDGTNWFGNTGLTIASPYETECLVDANCSDHVAKKNIGYVFFPVGDSNHNWEKWSLAIRNSTTDGVWFNTHYYTSDRPKIKNTDAFTFLTMIANGTYAAIFSGLTEPTGATGRYGLKSGTTSIGSFTSDGWGIGGNPSGGTQQLIGTIKSFRHYSRVLSLEERAWNRAVDNYRFFGKLVSAIPVTNAVIASAVANVSGNEKAGAYAVDASGYTFSAPASKTVDGRAYTCTGYTLEAWDDATGDWGAPEDHSGSLSCAVTETSRVRITWQWTAGDGIVTRYTTADYVQYGLLLHYDGIRNLGADQPHSSNMTAWKNLAPAGGWDMTFHAKSGVTKPGEWRADGYRFEQQSWFTPGVAFTLPSNQTVQIAVEANGLDQEAYRNNSNQIVNESYLWYNTGAFTNAGSISLRRDNNATGNEFFDWTTHGYSTATGNAAARPAACQPNGTPLRYVTTVLADDYTAAFLGTSIPTTISSSRWVTYAVRMALTSTPQVQTASGNGFYIGGLADNTLRKFRGTIHNFRFYNRVLTDAELALNRVIDDYRFHGVMPVTNVIVASSHSLLAGNEANGNYEISGSYTFSASAETRTDSRGFSYDFKGYTLEAWDAAAQKWGEPVLHESENAFAYAVATSPAKVRLTWVWEASGNLRTAADYGLSDYVSSGLILHYDGIKNIGEESADVSNPTSAWSRAWANLVDPGTFTLSRQDKKTGKTTTGAGAWDADGFAFVNLNATTGSWFQCNTPLHLPPAHTFQFLADARVAEQHNTDCTYLMFNETWQKSSLAIRTKSDYSYALYYVPDTTVGDSSGYSRPKLLDTGDANSKYTYATAMIDGRKAMIFAGTDYPTDNPNLKTSPNAATAQTLTKIRIGGGNAGDGTQDFTGKIKNVRYYDRILTPEEMRRNRQVDSARYFGELAFTNVVVAVGEGLDVTATPAPGAYAVEGTYTFSVEAGNDAPNGYKLEEWDGTQWSNAQVVESLSYTYDAATSPAMVRVTWRKVNPFVLMMR